MIGRVLKGLVVVGMLVAVASAIPDIVRYLKIRRM
jgi:hypothetical protein